MSTHLLRIGDQRVAARMGDVRETSVNTGAYPYSVQPRVHDGVWGWTINCYAGIPLAEGTRTGFLRICFSTDPEQLVAQARRLNADYWAGVA